MGRVCGKTSPVSGCTPNHKRNALAPQYLDRRSHQAHGRRRFQSINCPVRQVFARAMVRDPVKAVDLAAKGVTVGRGNWTIRPALMLQRKARTACSCCCLLLWERSARPQSHRRRKACGGRQIVWSATGLILPLDAGNPSIDFRRPVLAALQDGGIAFAALQSTA